MWNGIYTAVSTLIIVIAILFLAYYATKKLGRMNLQRGSMRYIHLIDQLPLAQDRAVAIIEVDGRYLLMGVAPSGITLLKELEGFTPDMKEKTGDGQTDFYKILENFKNRKK